MCFEFEIAVFLVYVKVLSYTSTYSTSTSQTEMVLTKESMHDKPVQQNGVF